MSPFLFLIAVKGFNFLFSETITLKKLCILSGHWWIFQSHPLTFSGRYFDYWQKNWSSICTIKYTLAFWDSIFFEGELSQKFACWCSFDWIRSLLCWTTKWVQKMLLWKSEMAIRCCFGMSRDWVRRC
jgi:hypothetical protein